MLPTLGYTAAAFCSGTWLAVPSARCGSRRPSGRACQASGLSRLPEACPGGSALLLDLQDTQLLVDKVLPCKRTMLMQVGSYAGTCAAGLLTASAQLVSQEQRYGHLP